MRTSISHITSALGIVVLLSVAATAICMIFLYAGGRRSTTAYQLLKNREADVARGVDAQRILTLEETRARLVVERLRDLQETKNDRDFNVEFASEIAKACDEKKTHNKLIFIQTPNVAAGNETIITSLNTATDAQSAAVASRRGPGSGEKKTDNVRVVEVTVRGTFDSAVRFIENLHRFPYIVSIEELKMQPDGKVIDKERADGSGKHQVRQLLMRLRLATLPLHRRRPPVSSDIQSKAEAQAPPAGG